MRRVERGDLPASACTYLERKALEVGRGARVDTTWKAARKTKALATVVKALRSMAGPRERCMYCLDSRATDIDHFWPKARHAQLAFVWSNLLWACAGCNGAKLGSFPCDEAGHPLLLDPTADDPWEHLFYDSESGFLAARYAPGAAEPSPRGEATLRVIAPLNHQSVVNGRTRTRRRLAAAVRQFLDGGAGDEAYAALLQALRDGDDYGLLEWALLRDGREEQPFRSLAEGHADVVARLVADVGMG